MSKPSRPIAKQGHALPGLARLSVARPLEACSLALVLLTPSLFNPASIRVFEPEKVAFVRTIAVLMLALWAIEGLRTEDWGLRRRGAIPAGAGARGSHASARNPQASVLAPVAALMGAYLLAALLSELPEVSLLGSYRRQFGALTHLSYAAVFLVVAVHLRTEAQARRLLLAVAIGTSVPALYAVVQKIGLDPIPWGVDVTRRVAGTLGQPTFLGSYLAGAIPPSIYLLIEATTARGRTAFSLLLALQVAALLFSQSRGAWLGAVIGSAALLALLPDGRGLVKRLGAQRLFGMIAAATSVVVLLNLPGTEVNRFARSIPYLERAATLAEFGSGSGSVRALIWGTVPALVTERPLLGHGPEMMGYAFERHYPPALAYAENRTASADRAHNLLLELLVSIGALGLAAYLWLMVILAASLRRHLSITRSEARGGILEPTPRNTQRPPLDAQPLPGTSALTPDARWTPAVAGAAAGIVALLMDGMVGVPSASSHLLFWLHLAVMASATSPRTPEGAPGTHTNSSPRRRHRVATGSPQRPRLPDPDLRSSRSDEHGSQALTLFAVLVLLAVFGIAIVRLNLQPLLADVLAARASSLASEERFGEAASFYQQATDLSTDREYHLLLGQMAIRAAEMSPTPTAQGWLRLGEKSLVTAERLDPLDLDVALAQGKLHQTAAGLAGRPSEWGQAEQAFRRALELSPRRSYVRNRYGEVLASQGRHQEALEQYRISLELDPRYAATHGFRGDSLVALGRLDEALAAYEEARRLDPKLVLVRINLGELYLRLNRARDATAEYQAAVDLSPRDQALRARLAQIESRPR